MGDEPRHPWITTRPFQASRKEIPLPGYEPISVIAASLLTDDATLLRFHRKGWIQARERRGTLFLSADQRYRAKYILHLLQVKHLSDDQVQLVLSHQQPPYSAAEVDLILKRHPLPSAPGDFVG